MNKNLLFIIVILLSLTLKAQEKPIDVKEEVEKQVVKREVISYKGIEHLIKTNFLSDKSDNIVDFTRFDGSENSEIIDTDFLWEIINQQIEKSQIKKTVGYKNQAKQLIMFRASKKDALLNEFNEEVPVILTDIEYNSIKEEAVKEGLLVENKKGNIGIGARGTNASLNKLFDTKNLFIAKSLKKEFYNGKKINFIFDKSLFNSNLNDQASYEIDFNDEKGFRKIIFGNKISVNYSNIGDKIITIRSNNNTPSQKKRIARFNINVKRISTPEPIVTESISAYIPSNYPHGNSKISGKVYYYGSYPPKNPIIVPEGFDPENTTDWNEIYNIMNQNNFTEYLKSNGYDLVVLNFDEGGTYIEKNAYLLKNLIERVNQIKESNNKNVIIGPSMGGLISRYALAYMEKEKLNHDSKLFISFDSPHEGANIPYGVQHFVKKLSVISKDAKRKNKKLLHSVAAQQMLKYHIALTDGVNPYRKEFTKNIDKLYFPEKLRKIAIANGSTTKLNFNPGDKLLDAKVRIGVKIGKIKISTRPILDLNAYAIGSNNYVFNGLVLSGRLKVKFNNAIPLDNFEGGTTNTMEEIAKEMNSVFREIRKAPSINSSAAHVKKHCFIPTFSALGIEYRFWEDAKKNLLLYSPFDEVYFPKYENEDHVYISENFVNWVSNELVPEKIITDKDSRDTWNKGDLRAKKEIILKPGFEIKEGTEMRAFIKPLNKLYKKDSNMLLARNSNNESKKIINKRTYLESKNSEENDIVSIYPNPTSNIVKIKSKNKIISWELISKNNKVVKKGSSNIVNIQQMSQGVYFIKINTGKGKTITKKVIKI